MRNKYHKWKEFSKFQDWKSVPVGFEYFLRKVRKDLYFTEKFPRNLRLNVRRFYRNVFWFSVLTDRHTVAIPTKSMFWNYNFPNSKKYPCLCWHLNEEVIWHQSNWSEKGEKRKFRLTSTKVANVLLITNSKNLPLNLKCIYYVCVCVRREPRSIDITPHSGCLTHSQFYYVSFPIQNPSHYVYLS